ncbi:MAG: hypothetical protein GXP49_11185 [Deltaproteobacteria bacterium]|nr:hypothetical protein [Deltaproteobacteria bacterium]
MIARVLGLGILCPEGRGPSVVMDDSLTLSAGRGARVVPAPDLDPIGMRRMDRLARMVYLAGRDACMDSGLDEDLLQETGVILGTVTGGLESSHRFLKRALDKEAPPPSPVAFTNSVRNAASGHLAIALGAKGPCFTVTIGESSGLGALYEACMLLDEKNTLYMIAGGAEELPSWLESESAVESGYLPWSEGAFLLALGAERISGGNHLADILDICMVNIPSLPFEEPGDATACRTSMRSCLERQGINFSDVGLILASSPALETRARLAEDEAIRDLFDMERIRVERPILNGRSWMGHGAGRAVAACIAVNNGISGKKGGGGLVLVNSFSPGGTYISMLFGK